MNKKVPPIYFYLPKSLCSETELPQNSEYHWQWLVERGNKNVGNYAWTLLTYLYLRANDFPCHFTNTIPSEGICLSHRSLLSDSLKPNSNLLIVALQADRGRHPYAQLHVVQNPLQQTNSSFSLWQSFYIPHWTQPGLIPRNQDRGELLKNIAFFGYKSNLIYQLDRPLWENTLKELDLRWQIIDPLHWNDYSQVDAVVAIRKFGYNWDHTWKPATKLHNAWLAGVPAILGCESAYQAERRNELDYIEVKSYEALVSAIKNLREDKELRSAMIDNARLRAEEVKPQKTVKQWQNFLLNVAIPAYQNWHTESESSRKRFLKIRSLAYPVYFYQRQLKFFREKVVAKITRKKFVGQDRRYL